MKWNNSSKSISYYHSPSLDNLNSLNMIEEVEFVVLKITTPQKIYRFTLFHWKTLPKFKESTPILHKIWTTEKEETLPAYSVKLVLA